MARKRDGKAIKWVDGLRLSARFSIRPRRFLPFFILDMVAATIFFMMMSNMALALSMLSIGVFMPELVYLTGGIAATGIVWYLFTLWITGAVVHQSWKEKSFRQSWPITCRRFPTLFVALGIAGVVTSAMAYVPVIGPFLGIIAGMAFLFVTQFVMVKRSGFREALVLSMRAFMYKTRPVFLAWLFTVVFSGLIVLAFSIPILLTFMSYVAQYGPDEGLVFALFYLDTVWLFLEGAIFLLGLAIAKTFGLKFLTEIFLQMQKKRHLIF